MRHLFPPDLLLYPGPLVNVAGLDVPSAAMAAGAPFTVWTERTGGANVTADLRTPDGVTAVEATADAFGRRPWLAGPDTIAGAEVVMLYSDTGAGDRTPMPAIDVLAARMLYGAMLNVAQTWSGVQTFDDPPEVPDDAFTFDKVEGLTEALNGAGAGASNTFRGIVSSQAGMLATSTAIKGDWVIRSDLNQRWDLTTNGYATLENWTANPVVSAGSVTLASMPAGYTHSVAYAVAAAAGTRAAVMGTRTDIICRIDGGTLTDPDPTWMIDRDYRDIIA